jgi:cation diffusion facilitator family transporter
MKKNSDSIPIIIFAFGANLFIAITKLIVFFITSSSAILAEAIHSIADTMNQILLFVGIMRGRKKANEIHPFGYSGEMYFWSFIVSIILFTLGSVFSIYEGINKINNPQEIHNIKFAFLILFIALFAEGAAFYKALRKVRREKGKDGFIKYLRLSKRSELLVVFLEDFAAICGLLSAIILLTIQYLTKNPIFDAIASIVIGVILAIVAIFLGNEIKSLLIGESASPDINKKIISIINNNDGVNTLIHLRTLQLGPEDILAAVKVEFNNRLNTVEISNLINGIETEIRNAMPVVKKIFIEPDIYKKNQI